MNINDFNFELPKELIAQKPLEKRSSSKMLVVDRKTGQLEHQVFANIVDYLQKDSVLVVNQTKVIPARIIGVKEQTNAVIELLLLNLNDENSNSWLALTKPAKRVKIGTVINFGDSLFATCIDKREDGICEFSLKYDGILLEILDKLGTMPLPPYITETLDDQSRYQTVYAKTPGSAAAPTAGLHFTKEILQQIKDKGIQILSVTLHVGLGTFRPVSVENIFDHKMHSEYYEISGDVARHLNDAKKMGKKIVSVGTTTTRVLETVFNNHGKFVEEYGNTDIFIYPGYKFSAVDQLITNFHLPKSTLIMLVSAFSSTEMMLNAYKTAVDNKYRFFSFGDSMFIK